MAILSQVFLKERSGSRKFRSNRTDRIYSRVGCDATADFLLFRTVACDHPAVVRASQPSRSLREEDSDPADRQDRGNLTPAGRVPCHRWGPSCSGAQTDEYPEASAGPKSGAESERWRQSRGRRVSGWISFRIFSAWIRDVPGINCSFFSRSREAVAVEELDDTSKQSYAEICACLRLENHVKMSEIEVFVREMERISVLWEEKCMTALTQHYAQLQQPGGHQVVSDRYSEPAPDSSGSVWSNVARRNRS